LSHADLIHFIAASAGVTQDVARRVLAALRTELPEAVWKHGRVNIPGVAVFTVRRRKARKFVDPNDTAKLMRLPPSKVVFARVAGEWRHRG
jgi:nucleoid DNA-binding protein